MTIDFIDTTLDGIVSMKSGLEGRNNRSSSALTRSTMKSQ